MVATKPVALNGAATTHPPVAQVEPQPMLWTTDQFHRISESGVFERLHVELIEGVIVGMMTLGSRHVTGVTLAVDTLREVFGRGYVVRQGAPLNISRRTDPEPDAAVVTGSVRDYTDHHPTTALLVVEVSDTTLTYDRGRKASLYARAGIEEYWIVNLNDDVLEVYRQPVTTAGRPHGHGYAQSLSLSRAETVTPLAASDAAVRVADLLP